MLLFFPSRGREKCFFFLLLQEAARGLSLSLPAAVSNCIR